MSEQGANTATPVKTKPAFKKLKQVTLPVLKMKVGIERYFLIKSAMRTGKQVSDTMGPAELVDAIDLETGELGVLIVPKVVQNVWTEEYADGAYVGKAFSLMYTRVDGKRYNIPTIAEIEPPAEIPEFDPAAKAAQAAALAEAPDLVDEHDAANAPAPAPAAAAPAPAPAPAAAAPAPATKAAAAPAASRKR